MRIVDRVHHDTSSLESYINPEYSAPLGGPAPACKDPASGDASLQPRYKSTAARYPITVAMSWLAALLLEVGAAYCETIYPGLLVLTALNQDQELEQNSQRRCQAQDEYQREPPWLNAPPPPQSENVAISKNAHHPRRFERAGLVHRYQVLGKQTLQTSSMADKSGSGGARRSNAQGYRHSSEPNREAWRSLPMVTSWPPMRVH